MEQKQMTINSQNYVDRAETVMAELKEAGRGKIQLTTNKIRNLLAMTAELKTAAQRSRQDILDRDLQSRVQYLKMRVAYEAGRENVVRGFVDKARLLDNISAIGDSRENLLLFCNYMEALTAYHRFYGGREN